LCACAVVVAILVTRIARDALRTAIEESGEHNDTVILVAGDALAATDNRSDVLQPLIIKIDASGNGHDGALPLVHKSLDQVV